MTNCIPPEKPVGLIAVLQILRRALLYGVLLTSDGFCAAAGLFPIGVWLQNPTNTSRYAAANFNTYVGLWEGPTQQQLDLLHGTGMKVVCAQNEIALRHLIATNIIAWTQNDEPDNALQFAARLGFGAPTSPAHVVSNYVRLKQIDPTRPVFLNLGQGVAWDNWYGRGRRNRHSEDYPEYLEGCDIASFDIYPVNHPASEVAGNLWYVPQGVGRLRRWTDHAKPVWNFIECTAINHPARKPTPTEVRAQVWMSIIHGSRGIVYFVHQFKPVFREAALLDDPEMLTAVTRMNRQITELAPVLLSEEAPVFVTADVTNPALPIATLAKRHAGSVYVFAVAMRPLAGTVDFRLQNHSGQHRVEVLGENRSLPAIAGRFTDHFKSWDVHLYRVINRSEP